MKQAWDYSSKSLAASWTTVMSISCLALLATGVVAPEPSGDGSFTSSRATVMAEGDIWRSGEKRFYHQNRCKVKLQNDGNFVVKSLVGPLHYQTFQTSWHTSPGPAADGNYYAQLDGYDGSLVVYHGSTEARSLIYTSNIGDPERLKDLVEPLPRDHRLTINEQCILEIFRSDMALWTNNRFGGLDWADYLEDKVVLWTSNSGQESPINCYLYSDGDKVRLYSGTLDKNLSQFEPRLDPVLWDGPADFQNPCGGGYEVLLDVEGGLIPSC